MSVSDTNFLKELKKIADYSVANNWVYLKTGNPAYWDLAVRKKGTSCANAVCLALQNIGVLKKNQMFYANSSGVLTYQVYGNETKERCKDELFKYFHLIKVGTSWSKFKSKAKAGDICLWAGHTSVFAGVNKDKKDVWYDWGRGSTYKKEAGSKFKDCHRTINRDSQKCTYVLRLKDEYLLLNKEANKTSSTTVSPYYKKYTGSSLKIDEVFKECGVSSKYIGSVINRKPIAKVNGISDYQGSATQNLKLISLAKKGTLKRP